MRSLPLIMFLVFVLHSCISTNRLTTRNYSGTTSGVDAPFRHTLVHENDSISNLIVEVIHSELKYIQKKGSKVYKSKYTMAYEIYPDITSNKVSDSNSITMSDSLHFATFDRTVHQIPVKIKDSSTVFLSFSFTDHHQSKTHHRFLEIEKTEYDRWNFLVKNSSGKIQFDNFKKYHDKFRFEYRGRFDAEMEAYLYDLSQIPPARAPFTKLEFEEPIPDKETINPDKGVVDLKNKTGLLLVRKRGSPIGGYPFLSCNAPYPRMTDAEEKIQTLRYITSNEEFLKLSHSKDKKEAYTAFWNLNAGDYDRAYSKMEDYERNVARANRHFSLSCEGWKSDRGMIYIVFGHPDKVLKYEGQEKWIYHNQRQGSELVLVFKKKYSFAGIRDYFLERKEAYRIPWYKRVEHWKN